MKKSIAKVTLLLAALFVSTAARADCTTDPFRMGWDAARQACEDLAQRYVPQPFAFSSGTVTPERTCTVEDVVRCKNAMAQYIRSPANEGCANLIHLNVTLSDPSTGESRGYAQDLWRAYVTTTCNL